MTREAYHRLVLIAAATGYFVAVAAAVRWISLWCLAAVPLGIAFALALTIEQQPDEPEPTEETADDEVPQRPVRLGRSGLPRDFERIS